LTTIITGSFSQSNKLSANLYPLKMIPSLNLVHSIVISSINIWKLVNKLNWNPGSKMSKESTANNA
jgi:hypothetical protein